MKKIFKISYHSFIDVITNSSSELFVSTDKNVINFFKEVLKLDEIKSNGSYIKLLTAKQFKEDFESEDFEDIKDDDLMLICEVSSESYEFLEKVMNAFNFKSIAW